MYPRPTAREMRELLAYSNVTPIWLLYYWRLLRGKAAGDYAAAFRLLPDYLPQGMQAPTIPECALVLADHGLA